MLSFLFKIKDGVCQGLFGSWSDPKLMVDSDAEQRTLLEHVKSDLAARNVQFVEPMPKEVDIECTVCLSILLEPYIVECCGHRFCKVCIEAIAMARQPCPLCKARIFQRIPDKHLQRLLQQRKVYCLLRDEGCKWTGEMHKLNHHLQIGTGLHASLWGMQTAVACEHVPIPCPQCKLLFSRRDMSDHETECLMREVKCCYCGVYSCPLRDVSEHYENCPSFPVLCPNKCALETHTREDLQPHLDNECPLEQMKCEYHYAGCEVTMLRGEMPDHLEKNMKKHLTLLTEKYKDIESKYENLKANTTESNDIRYLHISNLPEAAHCDVLHSRFGQFGAVTRIDMVPSRNEAIIVFANSSGYTNALSYAQYHQVNLLKHSLRVTPMYSNPFVTLSKQFREVVFS